MWCNSSAQKVKIMCRNFPLQFNVICICRNTQDHSIFTAALATILPNLGGPKHSQRLVTKVMRSILQSASFTRWRRLETRIATSLCVRLTAKWLRESAALLGLEMWQKPNSYGNAKRQDLERSGLSTISLEHYLHSSSFVLRHLV